MIEAALKCGAVVGLGLPLLLMAPAKRPALGAADFANPSAAKSAQSNSADNRTQAAQSTESHEGLVIEPVELPNTYPHGFYEVVFHPRGNSVPPLHWRLEKGALPPGIRLEDHGVLRGEAQRAGEYHFTVSVRDSGSPPQAVQRDFVIQVMEALTINWGVAAHVNVNRIEGTVEVSNTTADDIDLTFDVKAVAENGRATEIGYQHFPLRRGTIAMALPFGDTLPHGAYMIYVDVNGEVASRKAIYKQQMKTPKPLQVVVGP